MNSQREAFEKYRDKRNAELEADGLTHASAFWVDNTHYPTWQAATEQGMREAVGWLVGDKFFRHESDAIEASVYHSDHKDVQPVYTHPPKPTGGGVPEGWKLVPIEPTKSQVYAAEFPIDDVISCRQSSQHAIAKAAYRAMLRAAPEPTDLLATQQPPEQDTPK